MSDPSKYAKILPLLRERWEIASRTWDYDPHNYKAVRQTEDLVRVETELDEVFKRIILELRKAP
jgi:hypothetical protein